MAYTHNKWYTGPCMRAFYSIYEQFIYQTAIKKTVVATRADEANHVGDLHALQPASMPTPEESRGSSSAWLQPVAPRPSLDTVIGPPAPTAVLVTSDQRNNSPGPSAPTTSLVTKPSATNSVPSASTARVPAENSKSNTQPQTYVVRAG